MLYDITSHWLELSAMCRIVCQVTEFGNQVVRFSNGRQDIEREFRDITKE